MAISPQDLLELALFKFEQHFQSARTLPQDVHVPDRGIWKDSARNASGIVQTVYVRLGKHLLEVKNYPVEYPALVRLEQGDIWLFDVSHAPRQDLLFHLSKELKSGIRLGTSPTGADVDEADLPPGLMKSVEKNLIAI